MQYFISFIILLFCSTALFSQKNSDTTIITLQEVTIKEAVKPLSICTLPHYPEKRSSLHLTIKTIYISNPSKIVHTNHSEFGLPIRPFRFENINKMANTVAGVLCY